MGKKVLIFIIIIIVLLGGGYYLFQKNQAQAPSQAFNTGQNIQQKNNLFNNNQTQRQIEPPVTPIVVEGNGSSARSQNPVNEKAIDGNNMQVVEVDFDGAHFTPTTIKINVGDWVFFKNKSSTDFWPASNPHPSHTDYPGFDPLKPIAPGGEYKFQFTKAGNWGFHDHLNAAIYGAIIVSR